MYKGWRKSLDGESIFFFVRVPYEGTRQRKILSCATQEHTTKGDSRQLSAWPVRCLVPLVTCRVVCCQAHDKIWGPSTRRLAVRCYLSPQVNSLSCACILAHSKLDCLSCVEVRHTVKPNDRQSTREAYVTWLCRVSNIWHMAKNWFAVCQLLDTLQTRSFPCAKSCRMLIVWLTAKSTFAMCSRFYIRILTHGKLAIPRSGHIFAALKEIKIKTGI